MDTGVKRESNGIPTAGTNTLEPLSTTRRPYEPPRIERRIPVAANTMQPTSGSETQFPDEP